MKLLKIIFISACFIFSTNLFAQELQWFNIFEKEERGKGASNLFSIDQTSNGDYVLLAYQESFFNYDTGGQGYILRYNAAGEILMEDSLDIDRNLRSLGLAFRELPDGTYMLILKNGEVYGMDSITAKPNLMFTIKYEEQAVKLNYTKERNNMLTLVGRVDTSTFHFKIDLEEKKLTDTYLSDSTLGTII